VAGLDPGLNFTVLKGPSLAASYPPGVLRSQGDIDLLVPDQAELWRVVRALHSPQPTQVWVTVVGPEHHLLVTLVRPPEEPLLDPEHRVELLTAALLGDFGAVPIRSRPPLDRTLADLVCLAEERLQRPFHPRDALDLYVLSARDLPPRDEILRTAVQYRLAPELAELVRYTAGMLPLDRFTAMLPALDRAAESELALRARHPAMPPAEGIRATLRQGGAVHGISLGPIEGSDAWTTARLHWYDEDEALLLTPVGAYLLVADSVVSRERHAAASAELDRLVRSGFRRLHEGDTVRVAP